MEIINVNGVEVCNCTPHILNILTDGGTVNVPPSGLIVRVEETLTKISEVAGMPVSERTFGEVADLPEEKERRIYIISSLCLEAIKASGLKRGDLYAPGPAVRDAAGKIIGAKGLVK